MEATIAAVLLRATGDSEWRLNGRYHQTLRTGASPIPSQYECDATTMTVTNPDYRITFTRRPD